MVIIGHVVKGRHQNVIKMCTYDAIITEMESLDLESDKPQCFNHTYELDSTVQLPKFRSVGL